MNLSDTFGTLAINRGGTNATSYSTGTLLAFDGTSFVSTSTIGNNQLQNSSLTVSAGAGLSGGGSVVLGGSTSLSLNTGNANWWTATQNFTNASTSLFTATSSVWFTSLATPAGTFLAVDNNGKLIATTTPAVGGGGTVTSVATDATLTGGPITTTGTLGLNLGNSNWWTATQNFTNASTSMFTATSSVWFTGVTASSLLALDANQQLVASSTIGWNLLKGPASSIFAFDASGNPIATTSIGTNYLTGTLATINSTAITAGGTFTIAAASSTLLANNNTWTGLNTFANSTTSLATLSGTTWFTNGSLNNALLSTDANGKLVATTTPTAATFFATSNTIASQFPYASSTAFTAATGFFTTASTTNLTVSSIQSSLITTSASGVASAYTGSTCTNQFVRSLNGAGAATCASVSDADFTGTLGIAHGGTNQASQTTNGVNYFDGTRITSGSTFIFNGTNVGIGTTSPQTKLEVADSSAASTTPFSISNFGSATSSTKVSLAFRTDDITHNTGTTTASIFSVFMGGTAGVPQTGNGDLAFATLRSGTLTEGARLTSAGNFGVGTTSPSATFAVQGNVYIFGNSTTTNIFSTTASSTNLFSQTASLGTLTVSGNTTHTGTLTQTGLATFTNGFLSIASSTITSGLFSMNGGASTTAFTNSGATWLTSPTASSLLALDNTGKVIATTTIGWNLLKGPASSIFAFDASGNPIATTSIGTNYLTGTLATINSTAITAGGTFTLTAASSTLLANNNTWTGLNTFNGNTTLANATTTNLFSTTASSTNLFSQTASLGSLNLPLITNAILSVNASGAVVATTSIGVNYLTGILPIANGGTNNNTGGTTNGINYFDGTKYTNNANLQFVNNSLLAVGTTTPFWALTVASSTGPQIALVDTTSSSKAWTLRSISNSFYLATSTATATSSTAAFALDTNGFLTLPAMRTTSGNNCLQVDANGKLTNTGSACGSGGGSWPWTTATTFATSTNATTTPTWYQMGLYASSTSQFANASTSFATFSGTTWFTDNNLASALLSTDNTGKLVATTSIGTNYLSGVMTIAQGGTNQGSQTTNGVNYFDGTQITSGTVLSFDGTTLTSTNLTANADLFVTGITTLTSGFNSQGLSTFTNGYIDSASSTHTAFTQFANASTTQFTNAGSTWLGGTLNVTGDTLLANATTTNLFSTTASSTNLFSQVANIGMLSAGTLSLSGLGTFVAGFVSQASSTVVGDFTTTANVTHTLAASSTFVVGANDGINPAFQIFASTTNAGVGLALTANRAGDGLVLQTTSSGTNENLTLLSKGTGVATFGALSTGNINLQANGINKISLSASGVSTFTQVARTGSAGTTFTFTPPDESASSLTAGFETPVFEINNRAMRHLAGAMVIQRFNLLDQGSLNFNSFNAGANIVTDTATLAIAGAPLASSNAKITNAHGLLIQAGSAMNASTTNGYGLTVNAPTGAVNNISAQFLGGNVGIGTSTPWADLSIAGTAGGTNPLFTISSSTSGFATTTAFLIDQNGNTTIGNNGSVLTVNGATTTHANGINIALGCFSVNGTCLLTNAQLLASANTWTGLQTFNNSSTTLATLSGTTWFTNGALNNALLSTDANGKLIATTTPTAATFFATSNTVASQFPYASSTAISATTGFFTTASTTNLTVSSIQSSLITTSASGVASAYAGSTCTNQFVRSLNGAGAATCASVSDADFTGTLGIAHGGTGAATFGQGWIYSTGGTTALVASTSPTVNYLTATSTTGTSFFAGALNVSDITGSYKYGGNTVLYASTTNSSLAVGASAAAAWMAATSTLTGNLAIGSGALATTPTNGVAGRNDTAVGLNALNANTSGYSNSAFGVSALQSNTTGFENMGFGMLALNANTTGTDNVADGYSALSGNITGIGNVGIGSFTLGHNQSATGTVAIGFLAGYGNGGNYSNQGSVAIGYQAGQNFQTGSDYNTLLGWQAGTDITSGNNNLILGSQQTTGNSITTGSNNILLGQGVRSGLSQTGSNQLNIGNLIFGTGLGNNNTISTGNIGIGTSTPWARISIAGSAGGTTPLFTISSSTSGFATTTAFLVDQNGNTTIGNNGSVLTINGATTTTANGINIALGCFSVNGTCLLTNAQLLASANTWTGLQTFNNSSTSLATFSGTTWFTNGSLNNALLSTDANGKLVATTTPTAANFIATSTTATSIFAGGAFLATQSGNVIVGSTTAAAGKLGITDTKSATYSPTAEPTPMLSLYNQNASGVDGEYASILFQVNTDGKCCTNAIGSISLVKPSSASHESQFAFQLRTGNGTRVEAMRMTAVSTATGGRVGIGTSSPQTKLEVADSSAASTTPFSISNFFSSATSSTKVSLAFKTDDITHNTGTTTASIFSIFQGGTAGVPQTANGDLAFATLRSGTLTEGARLTSTGNFGVGTTSPFTLLSVGGSAWIQAATTTNLFSTTASSTNLFSQTASLGTLNLPFITNAILSTNSTGGVVASSTIGWNLLKGPASSIFAFDASGNPTATTSIGTNYLTGILPIATGGTNANAQTTNGVNYFDGTSITSGTALTFDGSTFLSAGAMGVSSSTTWGSAFSPLFVAASSSFTQTAPGNLLFLENTSPILGNAAGILFQTNEGSDARRAQIVSGRDTTAGGVGYLSFVTRSATFAERVRILGNGNVGIGTSTPQNVLSVAGASNFMGGTLGIGSFTGTEGGQLVLGWNGAFPTGQVNRTWNVDIDSSDQFRIFSMNASGDSNVAFSIASSTGLGTLTAGF
ncbi:MAG: hypothetical protein WC864_06070, partial [Ilumatobacteraceae bacterium]